MFARGRLALVPTGRSSSVTGRRHSFLTSLPPDVTFSRASSATYFNASGVLTTASSNVPRFDYKPSTLAPLGLLREGQSTNLIQGSNAFTNATYWGMAFVTPTAGAVTGVDGTASGVQLNDGTTANAHYTTDSSSSVTSGTTYTFSVYAQAGTASWITLGGRGNAFGSPSAAWVAFNLATGAVGNTGNTGPLVSYGIQPINNGWYRCWITAIPIASPSGGAFYIAMTGNTNPSTGQPVYTGTSQTVNVQFAQVEALGFPSSYIPTTSSTVTRAVDVVTISAWPGFLGAAGASMVLQFDLLSTSFASSTTLFGYAGTSGFSNTVYSWVDTSGNCWVTDIVATSAVTVENGTIGAAGTTKTLAASVSATGFYGANNGTASSGGTQTGFPNATTIALLDTPWSTGGSVSGHIKKFAAVPYPMSASQLAAWVP